MEKVDIGRGERNSLTGQKLLEQMLLSYESAFDITRPYELDGVQYDAYAAFNVTSAKYVLIKKAELWRANCFEHTFFSCRKQLSAADLQRFHENIEAVIEPELVCGGQRCPEKDHMYTYVTGIFYSEQALEAETVKAIRKFRYFKNYRLGIRGYCEARLLVFDMQQQNVLGNGAARELIKGYRKIFQSS